MSGAIVRIQDRSGRGPWRPGFSSRWVNPERLSGPPPIYSEPPLFQGIVSKARSAGLHIGCAVRIDRFTDWFDGGEIERLRKYGFFPVNASPCRILAETPTQILVGHRQPLKKLSRLSWSAVVQEVSLA